MHNASLQSAAGKGKCVLPEQSMVVAVGRASQSTRTNSGLGGAEFGVVGDVGSLASRGLLSVLMISGHVVVTMPSRDI